MPLELFGHLYLVLHMWKQTVPIKSKELNKEENKEITRNKTSRGQRKQDVSAAYTTVIQVTWLLSLGIEPKRFPLRAGFSS